MILIFLLNSVVTESRDNGSKADLYPIGTSRKHVRHLRSDRAIGIKSLGAGLLPRVDQTVVENEMSCLCSAALCPQANKHSTAIG